MAEKIILNMITQRAIEEGQAMEKGKPPLNTSGPAQSWK